jgi:prepilin-type N-terminal cleavage/methylation domain-containing protein
VLVSRAAHDERGFTLVELLVASMIGVIIIMGALQLMDFTVKSGRQTSDRVEAVQQGRSAVEEMTRQLRSQVCISANDPSLIEGTADRVVWHASLAAAPTQSGKLTLQRRTLEFVPSGSDPDRGRLVETVAPVTATAPAITYGATQSTRVIAQDVARVSAGAPIFTFHKYDKDNSPTLLELPRPVPAAERALVVRVDFGFHAYPEQRTSDKLRTVFEGQAFVRTADPTDPEHSPKCF